MRHLQSFCKVIASHPPLAPKLQNQSFSIAQKMRKEKGMILTPVLFEMTRRIETNHVQVFSRVCRHIISTIVPQELHRLNFKYFWIREWYIKIDIFFHSLYFSCTPAVLERVSTWPSKNVSQLLCLQGSMDNLKKKKKI